MARRWRRPRSRGLGKRAWLLTWSIRLVIWTLGFTRIIRTRIAMAMAELWKSPLTRWLVEVLGQIPVVRGDSESGKQAMESAAHALEDVALVGIFPEQKCVLPGVPIQPDDYAAVPDLLDEVRRRITSLEPPQQTPNATRP